MKLQQLLRGIEGVTIKSCDHPRELNITGISYDPRRVKPGHIFTLMGPRGFREADLRRSDDLLVAEAKANGAACVYTSAQRAAALDGVLPVLVSDRLNAACAELANRFHGFPSEHMNVVGVTGTNGKTSTVTILSHIYRAAGHKTATLGTLNPIPGLEPYTTPPSPDFFAWLAQLRDQGTRSLVLEATSHGLELCRDHGTQYDAAVFTNLTDDHLNFHGGMEAYKQAKLILFKRLHQQRLKRNPLAIINVDDPVGREFLEAARGLSVFSFALDGHADYVAKNVVFHADGMSFEVVFRDLPLCTLNVGLLGRFNIYNILGALAVAHQQGIEPEVMKRALAVLRPPAGRFEIICGGQDVMAIVDYAHTPDALEKILQSVCEMKPAGVITVFGCGGERDTEKRPLMGKVSASHSQLVVITTDNPRREDPQLIINHIAAGIDATVSNCEVVLEVDRGKAINYALSKARPGEVVVIAGKGHEHYQCFGDYRRPFDDREQVRRFFKC